jgi:hypothetical protein
VVPEGGSGDDALTFELANLLGGCFSARLGQRAEQLAEPKRLRFQRIHDHRFPFAVD